MRKFLTAILFMFCASSVISAQTESVAVPPVVTYSESKPYQPREFPAKKNAKPKKEKEAGKSRQATDKITPAESLPPKPDETITIPVPVFDANGRFVNTLEQTDFKVFVDGEEQEITLVNYSAARSKF